MDAQPLLECAKESIEIDLFDGCSIYFRLQDGVWLFSDYEYYNK